MRGNTLQCAPIAFVLLKVLIYRGMLADRGKMRGTLPHHAPIAQSIKMRGKTPHSGEYDGTQGWTPHQRRE
jgi:hypothetical protein